MYLFRVFSSAWASIHSFPPVWASIRAFLLRLWRTQVYGTSKPTHVEDAAAVPKVPPLSPKAAADDFRTSLRLDKVAALASRYYDGRPCKVLDRLCGSFNICFFVVFEPCYTLWTVRIPLEPRLHNAWTKVQSEVATLQYIRSHTTVPVPEVIAFGNDAILTNDETQRQMFIISDYIAGHPARKDLFVKADEETQNKFYRKLLDYLEQMRHLEFPKIGSLMPTATGEACVGDNILTFSANSLQLESPSLLSAKEYMSQQYDIVKQYTAEPADLDESACQYELFGLDETQPSFDEFIKDGLDGGPFILRHPDLHFSNILVDDSFNIKGLLDWEFAHTVPLQLNLPPLWAIYQEAGFTKMSRAFHRALLEASMSEDRFGKLLDEWYGGPQFSHAFYISHMLRRPEKFAQVFGASFAMYLDNVD